LPSAVQESGPTGSDLRGDCSATAPQDLLDVEDLKVVADAEMHQLVRRFVQVLHERQRRVPQLPLACHSTAQFEEPSPEAVRIVAAF